VEDGIILVISLRMLLKALGHWIKRWLERFRIWWIGIGDGRGEEWRLNPRLFNGWFGGGVLNYLGNRGDEKVEGFGHVGLGELDGIVCESLLLLASQGWPWDSWASIELPFDFQTFHTSVLTFQMAFTCCSLDFEQHLSEDLGAIMGF
jgi:hypothetical protein